MKSVFCLVATLGDFWEPGIWFRHTKHRLCSASCCERTGTCCYTAHLTVMTCSECLRRLNSVVRVGLKADKGAFYLSFFPDVWTHGSRHLWVFQKPRVHGESEWPWAQFNKLKTQYKEMILVRQSLQYVVLEFLLIVCLPAGQHFCCRFKHLMWPLHQRLDRTKLQE